jgi:hypothetical protein
MRPAHGAKCLRPANAGEAHEVVDRVLVGASGASVADVGEPFDLGRYLRQTLKLGGGQKSLGRSDLGWKLGGWSAGRTWVNSILDKICIKNNAVPDPVRSVQRSGSAAVRTTVVFASCTTVPEIRRPHRRDRCRTQPRPVIHDSPG